jgi:hypothetical protein
MDILNLQKDVLDLSKAFELNLVKAGLPANLKMQTRLGIDRSPSMEEEFECGWVAKTVDIFLAAALKFDDDGSLTVGAFDKGFKGMPDATIEDAGVYVRRNRLSANGNGTRYAPVIKNMAHVQKPGFMSRLFGGSGGVPVYLGLITDGDCQDRAEFVKALEAVDRTKSFIHIFGIGNQVAVGYMRDIASQFENVAFDHLPDPHKATADSFYELMCGSKFADWVKTNNVA